MKKTVAILLAIAVAFAMSVNCFAASYGDVDGNGSINSSDALLILQSSTGKVKLTSAQSFRANVNNDSKVNSSDALLVLSRSVGLINLFPVEEGEEPDVDHDIYGKKVGAI